MPHDLPLLDDLLILLVTSIPIAFVCHRLRLPVIVGFMITGVVIGPYGLGLIKDAQAIEALAEIGVVLLLFTIGLEFSLRRIMGMKRLVLWGGGLQVLLTVLAVTGLFRLLGKSTGQATFFGFLFALSSTAIVLKTYMDRLEIDTPHGKAGVGILLFQDLCIVPMMLLAPVLSGKEGSSFTIIAIKLGTALAVIAGIILAARFVVPFLLHRIVRLRSPEVFIIFVVMVSLGTAWLTSHFGLSMALGAFIAGIVLAESEYSHQIVSDVMPFRDVFNSVFFISIGMLLSLGPLAANLLVVIEWFGALVMGKAIIVFAVARLLGNSLRVASMVGIGLAQVGEFSFILAKVGLGQGLLSEGDYQRFLAASILSMIATPFLIKASPRVGYALQAKLTPGSPLEPKVEDLVEAGHGLSKHVVVAGYGMNGRNLTKVLHRVGIPYVVLELNAEVVRGARAQGAPIEYGDASRKEVLQHVGVRQAEILVVAISDPVSTRRAVALARELNSDLCIIVRTRYMAEVDELYQFGADQVIPEEFETSVEIFSRVLQEYGVSRNVIQREVEEIRSEGYQMLRSDSLPLAELRKIGEAFGSAATDTIFIGHGSPAIGKTLKEIDLRRRTGASVTAAIRDGNARINLGHEFRIEEDDILVLLGTTEQLGKAVERISQGMNGNDE
ncbi:MAG TPA: cation:proton antiporter [Blastocatellia bacterium]|jgi:CPA2 family monovalent cation:H+ antiporter-2|nr:cation:proton antiporter [Blastocatellia bacterium]